MLHAIVTFFWKEAVSTGDWQPIGKTEQTNSQYNFITETGVPLFVICHEYYHWG